MEEWNEAICALSSWWLVKSNPLDTTVCHIDMNINYDIRQKWSSLLAVIKTRLFNSGSHSPEAPLASSTPLSCMVRLVSAELIMTSPTMTGWWKTEIPLHFALLQLLRSMEGIMVLETIFKLRKNVQSAGKNVIENMAVGTTCRLACIYALDVMNRKSHKDQIKTVSREVHLKTHKFVLYYSQSHLLNSSANQNI